MRICRLQQDSLQINNFIKLVFMACCLQLTSCVTHIEEADIGKDWYSFIDSGESAQKRWDQLSATDGISIQDACFLSTVYFERYNGHCGFAVISGYTKDEWIFEALVGRNLVSMPPIKVDKLQVICPSCGEASRLGSHRTDEGAVRFCRKCKANLGK